MQPDSSSQLSAREDAAHRVRLRLQHHAGGHRPRLLIASLIGGLVIALLTVHLAGAWEAFG
jgi:hypothetical protein